MVLFHICLPSLRLKISAQDLRTLAFQKARCLQDIKAKMLICSRMGVYAWTRDIFNYALQHWHALQLNYKLDQTLHKGGDVNVVNNYRTIMGCSLMAKTIWMYNGIKDKCMG